MSSSILAPRPTDRPPPHEPWGRGVAVSVVAHALLIAALWWGVHWHNDENEGVSAELWAAIPEAAAPPAAAPPPPPVPAPAPAPAPTPTPAPPPPPVVAPKAPDIVTEQLKEKQKQQQLREQQEKLEEQQKLAREKAEQQARADAQKKAEQQKKADQQKQAEQQKQLDARLIAKLRAQNLAAMQAQLAGTGAPGSTGTAAHSKGPSADYAGRIKARVRPNIVFDTGTIDGNPEADVEVRCAPDGTIIGRRIVKSSGVPAYDDAVLRALDRTQVLPRDKDGSIPSPMTIAFHPQDQ